jgi:hypothetical protein
VKKTSFSVAASILLLLLITVSCNLDSLSASTPAGTLLWSKTYGKSSSDFISSVINTNDGYYALAGSTTVGSYSDMWLVKVDSLGNVLWDKTYGTSTSDSAQKMVQNSAGEYVLVGSLGGTLGSTHSLVKFDSSGNFISSVSLSDFSPLAITIDSGGNYIITGTGGTTNNLGLTKIDPSGNILWKKQFNLSPAFNMGYSVICVGGNYLVAGTSSSGLGGQDFLLLKVDASGNQIWSKNYGGTGDEHALSVVQTGDGGYLLAGTTNSYGAGNEDFWLVKTDSSGNQIWDKTYGGVNPDYFRTMIKTNDGGFAFCGVMNFVTAVSADAAIIKIDSSGAVMWSGVYGQTADMPESLIQNPNGDYLMTGIRTLGGGDGLNIWLFAIQGEGIQTTPTPTPTVCETDSGGDGGGGIPAKTATPTPTATSIKTAKPTEKPSATTDDNGGSDYQTDSKTHITSSGDNSLFLSTLALFAVLIVTIIIPSTLILSFGTKKNRGYGSLYRRQYYGPDEPQFGYIQSQQYPLQYEMPYQESSQRPYPLPYSEEPQRFPDTNNEDPYADTHFETESDRNRRRRN